jgi:uncharacterized protein (DUF2252 family)
MSLTSESDRVAGGRAIRSTVPRSSHGEWTPDESRADPVTTLRATESERLPELLELRYARMAESPFGFLRGSASVMAADLATTPTSGLRVQACGDAHIGNFRLLGTPERELNFDINDFDETLPAPFEWDLKRLAASAVVTARHLGLGPNASRRVAASAAQAYRLRMAEYARGRVLSVWYSHIDSMDLTQVIRQADINDGQRRLAKRRIKKAKSKDNLRAFRRLISRDGGKLRFRDDPPVLYHREQDADLVWQAIRNYRSTLPNHARLLFDRFELVDYAVKVVGVGSVGTRCWAVLFDGGEAKNPLVLQVKQASRSVLEPFAGPCRHAHQGQRVVEGQRIIQAAGDVFLGWTRGTVDQVDYYVRQLWDMKGRVHLEAMNESSLTLFADLSGWTLARAHARSGDPAAIHGYIGNGDPFDRAITDFAVDYADQTERDHWRLCEAIDRGEFARAASTSSFDLPSQRLSDPPYPAGAAPLAAPYVDYVTTDEATSR